MTTTKPLAFAAKTVLNDWGNAVGRLSDDQIITALKAGVLDWAANQDDTIAPATILAAVLVAHDRISLMPNSDGFRLNPHAHLTRLAKGA
jgi:hypothetical protein